MSPLSKQSLTCTYFEQHLCRSCDQIQSSRAQLHKEITHKMKETFQCEILPWGESPQTGFRNKVKWIAGGTVENPQLGILQEDLETIHEIPLCPIQDPHLNSWHEKLLHFIKLTQLTPYHIKAQRGELKVIILSFSPRSNQLLIRFVLRSKEALDRIKLHQSFLLPALVSVNIQPIPHALLDGPQEISISPEPVLSHPTPIGILYFYPQSFMQTNLTVAEQLYAEAATWINELKSRFDLRTCVEAFCGAGGFSLYSARQGLKLIAFEKSQDSLKGIKQTFSEIHYPIECHQVDIFEQKDFVFLAVSDPTQEVMIVNPPRRGLGERFLTLLKHRPPRFVLYSSCSIKSFSEDIDALSSTFQIVKMKPFEMFPHTSHYEILALLEKK